MQKINSEITKIVAQIINENFSEEINFASINFVLTRKDLSEAKVFVYFGSKNPEQEFAKFIKKAGTVQQEFAKRINLRKTPHLNFILDIKAPNINNLEKILDNLHVNTDQDE